MERANGAAAQFLAALKSNNALSMLSNAKRATVFVPPANTISSLDSTELRNHILNDTVFDRRVVLNRARIFTTEAGKNISIRFEYEYGSLFDFNTQNRLRLHVGCAKSEKIVSACNGAIVFLDEVSFCFFASCHRVMAWVPLPKFWTPKGF